MKRQTRVNTQGGRPAALAVLTRLILPAVALVAPAVLHAADEPLPKAEDVLDKFVEVTGGEEAYNKVNNRVSKLAVEPAGSGIKLALTVYEARPNKSYVITESQAMGKMESGTDGKVVWEKNMMTGPRIKKGEEKAFLLRASVFDRAEHWRKLFKKVECVGLETVDGKPCYKIVMTPDEGQIETRYFDKASGLLVKVEMTLTLPMGTFPVEMYLSDYKNVGGVLYSHKGKRVVAGRETDIVTENIEHNVELPADRFDLPEDIKALVNK